MKTAILDKKDIKISETPTIEQNEEDQIDSIDEISDEQIEQNDTEASELHENPEYHSEIETDNLSEEEQILLALEQFKDLSSRNPGVVLYKANNNEYYFPEQIIENENNYIKVATKKTKDNNLLTACLLSTYIIKPEICLIKKDLSNSTEEHHLQAKILDSSGNKSQSIIYSPDSLSSVGKFRSESYKYVNGADILKDEHFGQIRGLWSKKYDIDKVYHYRNAGLIDGKYWLFEDAAIELGTGNVYHQENSIITLPDGRKVTLDEHLPQKPYLKYSNKYPLKNLANILIETTRKGYGDLIAPFLALGIAISAPFRDPIKNKISGFPIVTLHGPTQCGKTNTLQNIAYMFGFDNSYISSGSSTVNATWKNLARSIRFPVILDETVVHSKYASFYETMIKSAYDCKQRERMFNGQKEDNQPVNGTLILSGNQIVSQKEEVLNRQVFTEFAPNNFKVDEVRGFNPIRENHLSNLMRGILAYTEEQVNNLFNESKSYISQNFENMRERDCNNYAVAFTGIKMLFEIADTAIPSELMDNFTYHLERQNEIYEAKTPFDEFVSYIPTLIDDNKISHKQFKLDNGKIYLYYSQVYKHFATLYRQVEGEKAPTAKEILNSAKYHTAVEKGSKQTTKLATIDSKKKRCLVIELSQFEDLMPLGNSDDAPDFEQRD